MDMYHWLSCDLNPPHFRKKMALLWNLQDQQAYIITGKKDTLKWLSYFKLIIKYHRHPESPFTILVI